MCIKLGNKSFPYSYTKCFLFSLDVPSLLKSSPFLLNFILETLTFPTFLLLIFILETLTLPIYPLVFKMHKGENAHQDLAQGRC